MPVLQFPNDIDQAYYNAYQNEEVNELNYFNIQTMHGVNTTSVKFDGSSHINTIYNNLKYIDLDQPLKDTATPFIESMNPFTIEITMDVHVDSSINYFDDKSRIFFAIGQYVAGNPGGIITVGTNANDSLNNNKPVLGFIDQTGSTKSVLTSTSIEIDKTVETTKEYMFRLVFNPEAEGPNRLLLFMSVEGGVEILQSTGKGLSDNYNYNITKPRLYLFTSGWTNEFGWNGAFDYAYGSLKNRSLQVHDSVKFSLDFMLTSLQSISYEDPVFKQPDGIDPDTNYISSEGKIELYF